MNTRERLIALEFPERVHSYTTRDTILLDGLTPKEIQTPVPTKAQATVTIPEIDAMHPVVGRYDDEVIVAPAWPGVDANGSSQRVVEVLLD